MRLAWSNYKVYNKDFRPAEVNAYLKSGFFKGFFTLKEFWDFYSDLMLVPEYKSMMSDKVLMGHTVQNNPVYGFYLCDDTTQLQTYTKTKNIIMFTGLHHSREPLTVTMIMFMVINILKDFTSAGHTKMKELFRDNIIFFVPHLNVDSYIYMTNMYREGRATEDVMMIRKNRHIMGNCTPFTGGVDLNRNYSFKFGLDNLGSSGDPCAEDYRGPAAFSELETQAIKRYVDNHKNIVSCVNIHSYGNAWLYPFNYVHDGSDHFLQMQEPLFYNFYHEFEAEMREKGRKTEFGNSALVLDYPTNGEAGDWFTGAKRIINLDVELGNTSKQSEQFYPPKDLIPKIVRYNWITMLDYLDKHIVLLDVLNIIVEKGTQNKIIFEVFNRAISNLKDAVVTLKVLFKDNKEMHNSIEWGIKALPDDVATKTPLRGSQISLTIRARHIIEIDVLLDDVDDVKEMVGLEFVVKRNEGNYLYYPDQKYIFKIDHPSYDIFWAK